MKINRRKFLKLLGIGTGASLIFPGKLVSKIPITEKIIESNNLIFKAKEDWGTITHVGICSPSGRVLKIEPVIVSQSVKAGDTVSIELSFDFEIKEKNTIGLFTNENEISGASYSRVKL